MCHKRHRWHPKQRLTTKLMNEQTRDRGGSLLVSPSSVKWLLAFIAFTAITALPTFKRVKKPFGITLITCNQHRFTLNWLPNGLLFGGFFDNLRWYYMVSAHIQYSAITAKSKIYDWLLSTHISSITNTSGGMGLLWGKSFNGRRFILREAMDIAT